jgi:hypothetical protein
MRFFDAALKTLEDLDWSQLGSVGHWAKVCVPRFPGQVQGTAPATCGLWTTCPPGQRSESSSWVVYKALRDSAPRRRG